MQDPQKRLRRERQTIQLMIEMNCRDHHQPTGKLCPACQGLSTYAMQRIERCPFKLDKPTCAKCPVHCYKPEMRAGVRQVMRYAGPRMLLAHPILAGLHAWDEFSHARKSKKANNNTGQD